MFYTIGRKRELFFVIFCLTFGITLGDCLVDILRGQRESLSAKIGIAFGAAVTRAGVMFSGH